MNGEFVQRSVCTEVARVHLADVIKLPKSREAKGVIAFQPEICCRSTNVRGKMSRR